ncbi:hypothetical protein HM1_2431 [Heliomicrobium modesticaldum Ice1]|uniref:Uncharacterized protein n=1 Tax=Heliobacterium modesticaldum (strain ATCC 51547 / Ice1) TaxID=498761 RepID=B0TAD1_HELMI|nr:hypothetical protein HM1_2431 [Heliomicrobium modesticaldum Ice1]
MRVFFFKRVFFKMQGLAFRFTLFALREMSYNILHMSVRLAREDS